SVNSSYGADGPGSTSKTYSLDVTGHQDSHGRVDSGLSSHGKEIYLYEINGEVVGSTSTDKSHVGDSNTIFTVSVDGNGNVTLTQDAPIDHADNHDTHSPYDDQTAVLDSGLISLTESVTVTDYDGDKATDSASIDLGGNIKFADDGPSVHVTA